MQTKLFLNNKLFYIFLFIISAIYLKYLIPANIDLSMSSGELFMDEKISYDEIYKIIHSKGALDYIKNVAEGDQRYGRIIYFIPSLFCYIPTAIFGEAGQIITTRFIFFIFLLTSYFIIVKTFTKNYIISLFLFISLLCLPTTAYYSTMPKPEPFLLFFVALFLFYFIKKNGLFDWYYIFLGLAFGCKISILPSIFLFLLYSFYLELKNDSLFFQVKFRLKNIIYSALCFLFGFFLAVPILPFSIFKPEIFKLYLYSTFLGTKHGSDDLTVNAFVWIKSIFTTWFYAPAALSIILFILLISSIFISFFKLKKYNFNNYIFIWLLLVILSISQIIPIIFFVKRVWFFYLHIGVVFFIVLFFFSIERLILHGKNLVVNYFYLMIFTFYSVFYLFNDQIHYLTEQSSRTKSEEYLVQKARYRYILKTLNQYYHNNENVKIFHSPQFFKLSVGQVNEIWGFFTSWDEGADFVILSNSNNPKIYKPDKTTNEFKQWEKSYDLYNKYVNGLKPKYIELPKKVEGLYIFKRVY